jgi:signal transduction histidine kinase
MSLPEPAPDSPPGPERGAITGGLAARREHSLLALAELGRALDLRLNEQDLAQLALYNLVGHFGAPRAVLFLTPEAGGPPEPAAVVGMPAESARALAQALEQLPAVWPAGETVSIAAAHWLGAFAPAASAHGLTALARLEGQHEALGFVALADAGSGRFYDAFDQELIAASLGIVSAAIENQRLLGSLHRGNVQLAAANVRMQELDRLRSEMLQNLNHEFRTPIAIIIGAAGCLRQMVPRDERDLEFLDMIEQQSAQVRDLVTMLLDHAELMSLRAELPSEPTDIVACVRDMVAARTQALASAQREVVIEAQGADLVARVEPVRLRRALDELLGNAIKFGFPGTIITIRIGRLERPGGARIAVDLVDHGRGMTAEQIAVAFQAFRQGDGSSTRTAGGLGIGLTACHRILELMGGSISLASVPGHGTTAHVELRPA